MLKNIYGVNSEIKRCIKNLRNEIFMMSGKYLIRMNEKERWNYMKEEVDM
jgi:hypothetical protein